MPLGTVAEWNGTDGKIEAAGERLRFSTQDLHVLEPGDIVVGMDVEFDRADVSGRTPTARKVRRPAKYDRKLHSQAVALKKGDRVEHRSDASLGVGVVRFVEEIAGDRSVVVAWGGATGVQSYTEAQLLAVEDLAGQLASVGPSATVPFQLRVLGRWFEARHEQTGEITNQPFDMLPHQVVVTNRVLTSPPAKDGGRHWLIADDVGLGKTIEAGMILEVMRHRLGGALRCLVVAPAGLVRQWQDELEERFGRRFQRFDRANVNQLEDFDQVVASIQTLRLLLDNKATLDVRPWDLVIFDEAHHLTQPSVKMYKLAMQLRETKKSKNTIFLTATPHSGNHNHFCNLLHLLRPDLVVGANKGLKCLPDLPLERMIIRNRKHLVTDAKGNKIFQGIAKTTRIHFQPTEAEVAFAEDVKSYLKHGYDEAGKLDKKDRPAVGFLMATFSKLASSSREALKVALQRRVEVLRGTQSELEYGNDEVTDENAAADVGGATTKGKKGKQSLISGEAKLVDRLLTRLEALPGPDSKLDGFASGLRNLVKSTPDVKVLIFTEYRATQNVLTNYLARLFGKESVDTINASKKLDERKEVVRRFNEEDQPSFIVSTAAGGEGLNMQRRCHTIVNYDLPWNPNVLQQRIGRVYRYGQTKPVVVYNLRVETASDAYADNKVYEYLEKKLGDVVDALAKAQGEGKEDLLGDVLGQAAEHGLSLEQLHQLAIEQGQKKVEAAIDEKANHLQKIMEDPEMTGMFNGLPRFNLDDYNKVQSRVTSDHLGFFVKQYCENARLGYRPEGGKRFSFKPSEKLKELAEERQKRDPYAVAGKVSTEKIDNATVDKEVAQKGARLLRFGDPVFEAMVHHVQFRDFSAVASLDVPVEYLGWARQGEGTWLLFELQIVRTERKQPLVLRRELVSFVVPVGGDKATLKPELVEHVTEATKGPSRIDVGEARRAFEIGRQAANARLVKLKDEVRADYPGDEAITPVPVSELALAWVRSV
jgi:superfamily II DNA or RNA helicase